MTRTRSLTIASTFNVDPTAHAAEPSAASKSARRGYTGLKTQEPTEVVPGGGSDLGANLLGLCKSLTAEKLAAALAAAAARPSLRLARGGSVRETVGHRVSQRGRLLES